MPYTNVPEELWDKMDACVEQVMAKDGSLEKPNAIAICHKQLMTATIETFQGARHSAADAKDMQDIHDIATRQGAHCEPGNARMGYRVSGLIDFLSIQEQFVATKPGAAYRLLPIGQIVKNGVKRDITREYAEKFRLPHFKPPIKLGSHDETTPAGGHILRLEVREDGLYALPETNDQGEKALTDGAYRYHSPEVIWEDGYIEDPTTGEKIMGPLIVGDALLHTPHLGEQTALYHAERNTDMTEMVQVPKDFWEQFKALFVKSEPPPPAGPKPEEFTALQAKATVLEAKIQTMEAESAKRARVEHFTAELKAAKAPLDSVDILAALPDEQAKTMLQTIKALAAQVDETILLKRVGSAQAAPSGDPVVEFNAAVTAKVAELKIPYNEAFEVVKAATPQLFEAYYAATHQKGK